MMLSFLLRVLSIGALTAGLAGCDLLGSVLTTVFKSDRVAVITKLDAPGTVRLGKTVHVTLEADVQRGYLLSSVEAKVDEASQSVLVRVQVTEDPQAEPASDDATGSAMPDPRPAISRASMEASFRPRGIGRYRIEAQVKWGSGIDSTATRDIAVLPPH